MKKYRCSDCMREIETEVCPFCGYDNKAANKYNFSLKQNTIINGRYLVGRVLGRGGFGITYVGFDLKEEVKVAVKEYYPNGFAERNNSISNNVYKTYSQDSDEMWNKGRESFFREAQKMSKLKDIPGAVKIRDVFYENNTAYIIMEYIDGITLKEYVKRNGTLKTEECIGLFLPLMDSLALIHRQGIIHRDISPDNIMVKEDGSLCVLDIGAAKDITLNNGKSSQLVAKKGYSPAEQYAGSGATGTWTDVYALCATMLYVISGKRLQLAGDRLYNDEFKIEDYIGENAEPYIKDIFTKGLAVNLNERIQDMAKLKAAFCNEAPEEEKIQDEDKTEDENKKEKNKGKKPGSFKIFGTAAAVLILAVLAARIILCQAMVKKASGKFEYTLTDSAEGGELNILDKFLGVKGLVYINSYTGTDEANVKVPRYYDGAKVFRIEGRTFEDHEEIENIKIAADIYSIGKCAFSGCRNLETVNIPKNVGKIDSGAFNGCRNLKTISIPKNIKEIYSETFKDCRDLKEIDLPEGLETIEEYAFADCTSLAEIYVPDSVTEIGPYAFSGCRFLKNINIPDGIVVLNEYVFEECDNLTEINIPDSVTAIKERAFSYCNSLTEVIIPDSVTELENSIFLSCDNLTSVHIPEDISYIPYNMFWFCSSLTSINIHDGITVIGDGAFKGCDNLSQIDLPEGLIGIGEGAFEYCEALKSVELPESVTEIGSYAFDSCKELESINIPKNVSVLNPSVFEDCENLKSIVIPEAVESIGKHSFSGCISLESVEIPSKVESIGNNAFEGCKKLSDLTLNKGNLTYIEEKAFYNCHLKIVVIPKPDNSIDTIYVSKKAFDEDAILVENNYITYM